MREKFCIAKGGDDMGRGDKRTKRGKIFRGSFGKSRPKQKKAKAQAEQAVQTEEKEQTTAEEQ
jgi:30S ribosomal protein S31